MPSITREANDAVTRAYDAIDKGDYRRAASFATLLSGAGFYGVAGQINGDIKKARKGTEDDSA